MKVEVSVLDGHRRLSYSSLGLCGRSKLTCQLGTSTDTQELCESRGDRPGLPVPNTAPYGLCGRKAKCQLGTSTDTIRSCVRVEVTVQGGHLDFHTAPEVSVDKATFS